MANLYARKGSPFYWLKFKEASGRKKQISTKFKIGVATDERRARRFEAEKTLEELSHNTAAVHQSWLWVPDFIEVRYKSNQITFERCRTAWATVTMFLDQFGIKNPAQFTRHHCFDYMTWRQNPEKTKGKYKAGHNTALMELKFISLIMQEAVIRELCPGNPCVRLNIKKEKPKRRKPEFTDAHCDLIRAKIADVTDPHTREFLSNSFEIARYQGCRLSETLVNPQTNVIITEIDTPKGPTKVGAITFTAKGGEEYTTRLHPKLFGLFERLISEGRTETWRKPVDARRQWAPLQWYRFLDRIGMKKILPNACFHSTRVTVCTRLARANVQIGKAKQYVNHASTAIHTGYQRLLGADLDDCLKAVE